MRNYGGFYDAGHSRTGLIQQSFGIESHKSLIRSFRARIIPLISEAGGELTVHQAPITVASEGSFNHDSRLMHEVHRMTVKDGLTQ
jgi:hypothetical protein